MNTERKHTLPFAIGDLTVMEELIPGVYYAPGQPEHYIVAPDCPHISAEAKAYGRPLEDMLLFPLSPEDAGGGVIEYEIRRYNVLNGRGQDSEESLLEFAVFQSEAYPEYFGRFPAPRITPSGYMTRWKAIMNGVFWMETDRPAQFIAIAYPLWNTDLSAYAQSLGEQTEHDRKEGIDNTLGYLFFSEQTGCIPLLELAALYPALKKSPIIDFTALNNAVLTYHPKYTVLHNALERDGLSSGLALLGLIPPSPGSAEDMIALSPDAGCRYLKL